MNKSNVKRAFSLVEISIVILIIGLLVAGISKASDMIFDAKLKTARSLSKGSYVNRVPNLILWLDSTVAESWSDKKRGDGTTYSSSDWSDINPQTVPNYKWIFNGSYIYSESGFNSLPSLKPTATITTSQAKNFSEIFDLNSKGFAVFAVVEPTASKVVLQYCASGTCASPNQLKLEYTAESYASLTYMNNTTVSTFNTGKVSDNGKIEIISAIANSSNANIFTNGELKKPGTAVPFNQNNFSGVFSIGDLKYYEIIVVGEWLDDTARKRIQDYLAKKWGVKTMKSDNFSNT